jgi:Effector-associated domain 7
MEQRVLVKNLLEQKFNMSEIESLCFDLGIDDESLPGDDKTSKAVAVVEYFERHHRWRELINSLQKLRPQAFMRAELEKLVNVGEIDAIRGYLDKHREIITAEFGNPYSLTLVNFHFGEQDQYCSDYLCVVPHSNVAFTSVVLLTPRSLGLQQDELRKVRCLVSESKSWVERNAHLMLELMIGRFNDEGSSTADLLTRFRVLPDNIVLDATFVIIVGRRSNNLRDLIWRIPTEGIKIVSYDRLIEAAQIFVRDVV